jgi:hypothetical protein
VTPSEAKAKRAKRAAKNRADMTLCARDFLTWGDTRGIHAKLCMFGPDDPCSRTYDPWPDKEASPDPLVYEGTGIGALYGLKGSEHHLWQLAGWNLKTQKFDPPFDPLDPQTPTTEGNQ